MVPPPGRSRVLLVVSSHGNRHVFAVVGLLVASRDRTCAPPGTSRFLSEDERHVATAARTLAGAVSRLPQGDVRLYDEMFTRSSAARRRKVVITP
jgi:hypothetical protein